MEKKIRKDLNDMVKSITLKKVSTKYNERFGCFVTLFNGVEIEFADKEGLYDLLMSFKLSGKYEGLIKSRKLVEEEKTSDFSLEGDDEEAKTYFCVLYELNNGKNFRLFLRRPYIDKLALENYYEAYKRKQAEEKAQNKQQVK